MSRFGWTMVEGRGCVGTAIRRSLGVKELVNDEVAKLEKPCSFLVNFCYDGI
ncbi:hypothetical protein Syun_006618 [Stephania yunnanensis]|uniref:Uncharacterized protein n=1 Tax=Stephania yunnanensis TaxID=152371 RepID=A0AAP0KYL5_9MAGN